MRPLISQKSRLLRTLILPNKYHLLQSCIQVTWDLAALYPSPRLASSQFCSYIFDLDFPSHEIIVERKPRELWKPSNDLMTSNNFGCYSCFHGTCSYSRRAI